jgi:hypothetical protein
MNRIIGTLVAVPLLAAGLAACGGGDETPTEQTSATATPAQTQTSEPTGDATGPSAVDDYCRQVDEYAAAAQQLLADPASGDAAGLQEKAQSLQETATRLTEELINDPSQAERVQECTLRLQEALAG